MWDERTTPLLDALPIGVLQIDHAGTLLNANRRGIELMGLDGSSLGRPGFADLVSSEILRAALITTANGLVRLNFTEGPRTLHAEIRPHQLNGATGKLLLLQDVTTRDSVALVRRNAFFDLLHKVRTPLTTVTSVLSLATNGRLDPSRIDFKEVLGMGLAEAERLAGILARLKDLYLVETEEIGEELLVEALNVNDVLTEVVRSLSEAFADEAHQVELDLSTEPVRAMADRDALTRAVSMVMENAFQYTSPGGRIHVSAEETREGVEIRVEDNGVGIPRDDLPTLFDRLRHGESGAAGVGEGAGLGLYLARGLLAAQNGTILVDSKPGVGTVAEIFLEGA